jgi:predicted HTH domain antitoxin
MSITFELPQDVEKDLRKYFADLDQAAKEAFLVQSYREGRLSVGQIASVMGKGIIDTQAWLSERGAPLNYSAADLEDDRMTLATLLREAEQ